MAPDPIVFALANPDPEIGYDVAVAARPDAIMATGRSDYPNQVNNVLGFPFIFRGALDVRATTINDEMKLAATRALAALAKEDVPDSVLRAYGVEQPGVRPRLHHPQAVRSARADLGRARRGAGRHGDRRGAAPRRSSTSTARSWSGGWARPQEIMRVHDPQGAARPSASSSPKARRTRSCAPARSCSTRTSPSPSCWATKRRSARARRRVAPASRRPGRDHRSPPQRPLGRLPAGVPRVRSAKASRCPKRRAT